MERCCPNTDRVGRCAPRVTLHAREKETERKRGRERERERERDRVRESTHGIGITLPTFPSLLCISETSNSDRRQKEIEERVR